MKSAWLCLRTSFFIATNKIICKNFASAVDTDNDEAVQPEKLFLFTTTIAPVHHSLKYNIKSCPFAYAKSFYERQNYSTEALA